MAMPPCSDETLLTRKEAVAYLLSLGYPATYSKLAKWTSLRNGGPPFIQYNFSTTRYRRGDLLAWTQKVTKRIES